MAAELGIARTGRGLAASLMLGADGVMLGSRLWASSEGLVHPNHQHKSCPPLETEQFVRDPPTSLAATTGRISSRDVSCARRLSRAGTVARRSIVTWLKLSAQTIWWPLLKEQGGKRRICWRGNGVDAGRMRLQQKFLPV